MVGTNRRAYSLYNITPILPNENNTPGVTKELSADTEEATVFLKEFPKQKEGRKEMFYLTTPSTHFLYGYMASDIW